MGLSRRCDIELPPVVCRDPPALQYNKIERESAGQAGRCEGKKLYDLSSFLKTRMRMVTGTALPM